MFATPELQYLLAIEQQQQQAFFYGYGQLSPPPPPMPCQNCAILQAELAHTTNQWTHSQQIIAAQTKALDTPRVCNNCPKVEKENEKLKKQIEVQAKIIEDLQKQKDCKDKVDKQRQELRHLENKSKMQAKIIEEMKGDSNTRLVSLKKQAEILELQCEELHKIQQQMEAKDREIKNQSVLHKVEIGILKTELDRFRQVEKDEHDNTQTFNDIHLEPSQREMQSMLMTHISLEQRERVKQMSSDQLRECLIQLLALRGNGLMYIAEIEQIHSNETKEIGDTIIQELANTIESEIAEKKETQLIESLRKQNQLLLNKVNVSNSQIKSLVISLAQCIQQQQRRMLVVLYKYVALKEQRMVPRLKEIYSEIFGGNKAIENDPLLLKTRSN